MKSFVTLCLSTALLLAACEADDPGPDPGAGPATPGQTFRAIGQEPGWLLTISPVGEASLEYDYATAQAHFSFPGYEPGKEQFMLSAREDGHNILIEVMPQDCEDSMNGRAYPQSVSVTIDGESLTGCGEWQES